MNLSNPVLAILLYNASQCHLKVVTLQNFYYVAHLYRIKTFVSSISATLKFNVVTCKPYLEPKIFRFIRHYFLKIQSHANQLFNLKIFTSKTNHAI